MGSFLIWHILIIVLVMFVPGLVSCIVVFRLPLPEGANRFGAPSHPAASGQALVRGFKRAFVFNGRASRSEFWWFLFWTMASYVIMNVAFWKAIAAEGEISRALLILPFVPLIFYLPLLSVAIRRLQDANRSGLWVLLAFGGFSVLALLVLLAEQARDGVIDDGDAFG
ncbi:hypothetical protein MMA231_02774 [Asticcacaulis sp. MM231]|uniref:DUF805 domain-containing protein n=1 Tax=Asticcacaulis sp. MM231 TaxID=3157666 RepID=UPI0032D5779C